MGVCFNTARPMFAMSVRRRAIVSVFSGLLTCLCLFRQTISSKCSRVSDGRYECVEVRMSAHHVFSQVSALFQPICKTSI